MQSVLKINKLEDLTMELTELSKLLKAQNESGKGLYNNGNLLGNKPLRAVGDDSTELYNSGN